MKQLFSRRHATRPAENESHQSLPSTNIRQGPVGFLGGTQQLLQEVPPPYQWQNGFGDLTALVRGGDGQNTWKEVPDSLGVESH